MDKAAIFPHMSQNTMRGGFIMKDGKSLGLSIFCVVLSIALAALIIFAVGVNYIFGSSLTSGNFMGMDIFVMNSDIMEPEIKEGSAVIANGEETAVLTEGNVILFRESEDTENVMRITQVVHNTDSTVYKVMGDNAPDRVLDVPKENVIAKCAVESERLGGVINFMKSIPGIIICMLIPCLILVFLIIMKISIVRKRAAEDEDIVYPETYGFGIGNLDERDPSKNPLFDPSMVNKSDDVSFEMKKSSIAEHFAVKQGAKGFQPTAPNERDMKKENAVERFKAAVDEKPPVPISRTASLAPDIGAMDDDDKLAAIKSVLENAAAPAPVKETAPETPEQPVVQPAPETDNSYEQAREFRNVADNNAAEQAPEEKALSSNPEDNIKSIDDLIKALEEEKKKL